MRKRMQRQTRKQQRRRRIKAKPLRRIAVGKSAPAAVAHAPAASAAGRAAGAACAGTPAPQSRREAWDAWLSWNGIHRLERLSWPIYCAAAAAFMSGFEQAAGCQLDSFVPLTTNHTAAAVVTVMNEEAALPEVIKQLRRLPLAELVCVVNGSTDRSFAIARSDPDAIVMHYPAPLGHDVGRAAGARLTTADTVLFLDGDFAVAAEQLVPFFHAAVNGMDIALNDITPFLGVFRRWDHVTTMKSFLNRMIGRPDLRANSLTAVPHAISRKALDALGCRTLAVPPLALQAAAAQGLRIGCPCSVDVVSKNKVRSINSGEANTVSKLIVGDHIEALGAAIRVGGDRLGHADHIRRRSAAGGESA